MLLYKIYRATSIRVFLYKSIRSQIQSLAAPHQMIFLPNLLCSFHKYLRLNSVELEHFVVTGNDQPCFSFLPWLCVFSVFEVAGNAAFCSSPFVWEQGTFTSPFYESLNKPFL